MLTEAQLSEHRQAIAKALTDGGIRAAEYTGETITPPCSVVVPGQPYMVPPAPGSRIPFGAWQVTTDVLVLIKPDTAKKAAAGIDSLICKALAVLDDETDVVRVARPGEVTLRGEKFIGAVITTQDLLRG